MKRIYIVAGGILVLTLVVLYVIFDRAPRTEVPIDATPVATTTPDVTIVTSPTTITGEKAPSLTRPLTFSSNLSEAAKASITKNIETFVTALKSDPTNVTAWLYLGAFRKMAGDYEGAIEAWKYVTALAPTNPTAFANLADLYGHFIKDYPQAEAYYQKAISLKPNDISLYVDLYYLYRDVYKVGTSAGTDLLKAGLTANPGNAELTALLGKQ